MTMNLRKNIGIIMMMLGVILTINHEQQNDVYSTAGNKYQGLLASGY